MKFEKIIKRDGTTETFNQQKIHDAIEKAFIASSTEYKVEEISVLVTQTCEILFTLTEPLDIETIQDTVEDVLIREGYIEPFQDYTTYRRLRANARKGMGIANTKLLKDIESITGNASANDLKRENANVDGDTPMGSMLQYGSTVSKAYAENYLLSKTAADAHRNGDIHIHDLDFYAMGTTTCLQIDLEKLFKGGFGTGHGKLREPQSIQSYAALAAIAIQANQNDQHGGQSIPMFDYYMAPGVLKTFKKELIKIMEYELGKNQEDIEEIKDFINSFSSSEDICIGGNISENILNEAVRQTKKATYQAMEGFIHNMNTMHSRAGAQVPFSSINFGTDTTLEGRLVTEQYLLALEAGLGNGETPIFPISIFKVKEGVNYNKDDINYDLFELACKVSAKRMFPNFSFIDAPHNIGTYDPTNPNTEVAYMGCRTRVVADVTDPEQVVTSRGNVSFTTINLPRLAIEYTKLSNKSDTHPPFEWFVEQEMLLVKQQLLDRFEYQSSKTVNNFPFLLGEGNWKNSEKLTQGQPLKDVYKHGSLSIGFIGLAEALVILTGSHHGESKESQKRGLEIIQMMRNTCDLFAEEEGLNFTLLATPAEGLSGRFVAMDRKKYGLIEGVTDKEYYTNSFHVPVYYNITAKNKIDIEAPYHALTNAGHISYIELEGDLITNPKAFMNVIRMMKEAGIGYGAINHPLDRDPVCGFSGVIYNQCPGCGRYEDEVPFDRIRRITGYLVGTLDRFNDAKSAEEHDRVKHGKVK